MTKTMFGVFSDPETAENAIRQLQEEGYNPKDISIIMKEDTYNKGKVGTGAKIIEKTLAGAAEGATIGGLAGLVVAAVFPGTGALMIGGPVAVALGLAGTAATAVAGATTGAVAGGVIGGLADLGLSAAEAKAYHDRIEQGAVLVAVPMALGDKQIIKEIFSENDASDVKTITHTAGMERNLPESSQEEEEDYQPIYTPTHHAYLGMKGGRSKRKNKTELRA